ncbi:MAG: HAMP domain-containing histidine kinase [Clostridia bacterium]|nr:HAMP domain-containing histidine kinase [Clostridia bacterium]
MKILPFSKRQYKSLMLQLFVQLLSIVLFMVAFLLIINSRFIETLFYTRARSEMSHAAEMIDEIEKTSYDFFDEMKKIEDNDTTYVEIFQGSSDKLLYSTIMNDVRDHTMFDFEEDKQLFFGFASAKKLSSQQILEVTEKGTFSRVTEVPNDIGYLMYTTVLETGDTAKIYAQENIIQSNAEYTSGIIRAVICIVGIGLMVAFFIYAWLFTRPLIEMNDVTKHMAKMDFTKKCVTKSTNELGQLAESINSMSDSLACALGDLKEKNSQLEKDIEHEHKMEKSRKEFISNVSHELKTPIAIIQGYAEGLKLGVSDNPEDNEEYLDVIIEESKKMNDIVLDLLELSYYESGSYKLNESDFSLNEAIEEYVDIQKIRLDENNINVQMKLLPQMCVWSDEAKISMVLNNYFNNAISHCEGEKLIRITAGEYGEFYRIRVFNTGKTIPEEHMEELWSNFFRGDKSHRRDEGRFGLGLSIVAAIQDMHGMKYGCENKNDGVEFWFDVKKHVKNLSM